VLACFAQPIEISPDLTREQKIPIMQEWYTKAHTLLLAEPFTPQLLESAAQRSKAALRDGAGELFALARTHAAPLVVCSAGLGNVVRALLAHLLPPSEAASAREALPVVSNWLRFDAGGKLVGFSEPLLHMFNKDGAFVVSQLGADRWAALSNGRTVCVLLGDGLGDADMADGLAGVQTVLKIGFLNEVEPERIAARLPAYERAFDIVILHDRSFDFVLRLLRSL
jgi:HAD superfamily hydrolase (TIGR01544 family)